MNVTAQLLIAATGCTADRAYLFALHLDDACDAYAINTPARLAAFLAQIGHESGSLRWVAELASGVAYEGRADLGNTQPGDGARFKGRGLIQVTGRDNYVRTSSRLREKFGDAAPNFVEEPESLEHPRWAALSAADWWHAHGLNALADAGEFDKISKTINRGNPDAKLPANGDADRRSRWGRAKAALATLAPSAESDAPTATPDEAQRYQALEDAAAGDPAEYPEAPMPLPAIAAALLPSLIESIPRLGKLFGSGSAVAERNVAAAELALKVVQEATGSVNAQAAVEAIKTDPAAQQKAAAAVETRWFELAESGGGGIEGARKADAAARAAGDMLHSPSFWVALALLPLVYLVVGSVVGLWGGSWSEEVRSAIANGVIGMVLGGLVGYYFGQTTSRNRTNG